MPPQQAQSSPNPLAAYGVVATPAQSDNPLASFGTPATPVAAAATPPEQPGVISRVARSLVNNTPLALIKPPETPTEQVVHATGGDSGLAAYRAAKGLVGTVESVVKAGPESYANAVKDYQRMHQEFINKDYRNAASSAGSLALDAGGIIDPTQAAGAQHARQLTEGARPGADLATPLTADVVNGALAVGGALEADSGAVSNVTSGALERINPFRNNAPEMTEAAVRGGIDEAAATHNISGAPARPVLSGNQTIVDESLQDLATKERAAYKRLDEASGFDLKAAKDQLALDKRAVKQPGMTPENLKSIQNRIADNADHIAQAEKNLTDQGIDPKEGDRLHTSRMAGQDFKNKLVQSTSTDGVTSLDKLLPKMKQLRFSPRGDRLEQFMGKEGAEGFMKDLQAAQDAGVAAMKKQQVAKMILKYTPHALGAAAGAGGLIYEATH